MDQTEGNWRNWAWRKWTGLLLNREGRLRNKKSRSSLPKVPVMGDVGPDDFTPARGRRFRNLERMKRGNRPGDRLFGGQTRRKEGLWSCDGDGGSGSITEGGEGGGMF